MPQVQVPTDLPGTMGEGDETAGASSGAGGTPAGADPGFGDSPGGGSALPDLRDEPTLEDSMPGAEGSVAGAQGSPSPGGGQSGPAAQTPGATSGDGTRIPGGGPGGTGAGQGPLTPAEQVAILDARLERGTGEFDAMILEEQAAQRQSRRDNPTPAPSQPQESAGGAVTGPYDGGMADAGGSTGGGMGGASRGGGISQNTAKYPPPSDIPNGDDDDVVARQLREAAMREADPAIREKLWDEYRKYKGISP